MDLKDEDIQIMRKVTTQHKKLFNHLHKILATQIFLFVEYRYYEFVVVYIPIPIFMCNKYILTYLLNAQKSKYNFCTSGASGEANHGIETNVEEMVQNEDTNGRDTRNAQEIISLGTKKVLFNKNNVYIE